jgi:hypothetical protein
MRPGEVVLACQEKDRPRIALRVRGRFRSIAVVKPTFAAITMASSAMLTATARRRHLRASDS